MNIYIYQNNKLTVGVIAPSLEEFNKEPTKYYPPLKGMFVASLEKYDYPIIEGNAVRNKTKEERIILDNEVGLLVDGEYVSGDKILYKECPTSLYKPQWITPNWIEGATLEECQQIKRKELQEYRDAEIVSDYNYNNNVLQADLKSQNKLFQAQVLGVGTNDPIEWVLADNSATLFNNQDLVNIVNGIAVREQQVFTKFNNLYSNVLNCTTREEIKNIIW